MDVKAEPPDHLRLRFEKQVCCHFVDGELNVLLFDVAIQVDRILDC